MSVLALIDSSSTLDTVDHSIFKCCLRTDFGSTGAVIQRFSSNLTDRTQYVFLCSQCSAFAPALSGIPLISVHGPMLFAIYIDPLSAIIHSHCRATSLYAVMYK